MSDTDTPEQKKLKALISRRHPAYDRMAAHWTFLEATYEGGREWFEANIHRYLKEGDTEFRDRVARAYRFNHTREVVHLINKYLFKSPASRKVDDAPEEIKRFWENATLNGLTISQFMEFVSTRSSVSGRPWIVVDNNKTSDIQTKADEERKGVRCYAYVISPLDALDMAFDDAGQLLWILIREKYRDDADPMSSSGEVDTQFRLWTRETSRLFRTEVDEKGKVTVYEVLEAFVQHDLGLVPVIPGDHIIGDYTYTSPSLIDDVAYLDKATANYASNLDAIIQDQTFSQLAMPAQAVTPGTETHDALVEMGTKRVFIYDGEGGEPKYLSPDPKQAAIILQVIQRIISEIYHTVGMAGERTKQDNAAGIDNSSGVAKAYDFERMNSLLKAKAASLEMIENHINRVVMAWHSGTLTEKLVAYPETFDVMSLFDEFAVAEQLMLVGAPKEVRRQQMELVIDKLFPDLSDELIKRLKGSLSDWLEEPDLEDPMGNAPAPKSDRAHPNRTRDNRQGQVTADTE